MNYIKKNKSKEYKDLTTKSVEFFNKILIYSENLAIEINKKLLEYDEVKQYEFPADSPQFILLLLFTDFLAPLDGVRSMYKEQSIEASKILVRTLLEQGVYITFILKDTLLIKERATAFYLNCLKNEIEICDDVNDIKGKNNIIDTVNERKNLSYVTKKWEELIKERQKKIEQRTGKKQSKNIKWYKANNVKWYTLTSKKSNDLKTLCDDVFGAYSKPAYDVYSLLCNVSHGNDSRKMSYLTTNGEKIILKNPKFSFHYFDILNSIYKISLSILSDITQYYGFDFLDFNKLKKSLETDLTIIEKIWEDNKDEWITQAD